MSSPSFWEQVCVNFKDTNTYQDYNIGYAHTRLPFILFPCISIFLNLIIILTYIRRTCYSKKKTNEQRDSMERMLYTMTYVELILSIYWLTNSTVFYNVRYLLRK